MACDVMTVRLHLAQIRVLEVVEDTPGALVVSVESTFRRLRCAQCGFKCHRVHDRRAKKVRDLEVSDGAPCWCGSGAGWCATTAPAGSWRTTTRSRARSPLVWRVGLSLTRR